MKKYIACIEVKIKRKSESKRMNAAYMLFQGDGKLNANFMSVNNLMMNIVMQ